MHRKCAFSEWYWPLSAYREQTPLTAPSGPRCTCAFSEWYWPLSALFSVCILFSNIFFPVAILTRFRGPRIHSRTHDCVTPRAGLAISYDSKYMFRMVLTCEHNPKLVWGPPLTYFRHQGGSKSWISAPLIFSVTEPKIENRLGKM